MKRESSICVLKAGVRWHSHVNYIALRSCHCLIVCLCATRQPSLCRNIHLHVKAREAGDELERWLGGNLECGYLLSPCDSLVASQGLLAFPVLPQRPIVNQ